MAAVTVGVVIVAAVLRTACPDKPLAFHALAVWSILILVANLANESGWGQATSLAACAVGITVAVVVALPPGRIVAGLAGIPAQWREIGLTLAVLGSQMALYLVPLLVVFPENTLVTGNLICHDSIAHGVLMRGSDTVFGQFSHWKPLHHYPDGFQAVVYALGEVFPAPDAPYVLVPASVWCSSFLGLGVLLFLHYERERDGIARWLIAASPAAAFLLATSVYLFFIGHMAVLAFVVAAVTIASAWTVDDWRGPGLWLAASIVAGSTAVYGLFPVTLFGLAMALRWARHWSTRSLPTKGDVTQLIRDVRRPRVAAGLALVLVLAVPPAVDMYGALLISAAQQWSLGNLPDGFLNPLHVTGFWHGGTEYRAALTGPASPASVLLTAVLVLQVLLVSRARLSVSGMITLATLGVPVILSAVVAGPYLNFKFLCVLIALWVPLSGLGLFRTIATIRFPGSRPAAWLGLAAFVALMMTTSMRSHERVPAFTDYWFRTLEQIRSQQLAQGPVMILSGEDWFQYYRDEDDVAPLTKWLRQPYAGQPTRTVLVDEAYLGEATAFLDAHLGGASARLSTCEVKKIEGRFWFYDQACLGGVPASTP